MGIEYELKFSADDAVHQAIVSAIGPMEQTISMATTYFDTPERALSDRRVTLRLRLENGVSVCTVKTPGGDAGRGEWECECDDVRLGLEKLCKLGAPQELLQFTARVHPICGARFIRQTKLLTETDFTAELALDTGVLTGGGKEIPLCEVELELKEGSREALDAYARTFAEKFRLQVQPKSKFRRASDLALGEDRGDCHVGLCPPRNDA